MTLSVVNQLDWPIYVPDDIEQLGLTIQESVDDTWADLAEQATCSCEDCGEVCGYCVCHRPPSMVRRIDPGERVERIWSGELRPRESVSCFGEELSCLGSSEVAGDGTYRLQLCWASSLSGAIPEEARFAAEVPSGLTCTHQRFELPKDSAVEIVTSPPPSCRTASDCPTDQLCLSGRCSATCLPHDLPAVGAAWNVEVGAPDDAGFFERATGPGGATVYRGSGFIAQVRVSNGTTNLTVSREPGLLDYRASFYFTLPGGRSLSLASGDPLEVVLFELPDRNGQARALTLRKAGSLLLIADTGIGGPALTDPSAASPFTVTVDGETIGCNPGDCGRRSHRRSRIQVGEQATLLDPGSSATLRVGDLDYEVISVGNYTEEVEGCGLSPVTPYAIVLLQDEGS